MASPLERWVERMQRLVAPIQGFFLDWLRRIIRIAGVDRALAIGAQAFGALFPLMILYATLVPGQAGGLADALIERFGLEGSAASTVRNLFGAGDEVTSDANAIGAVILVVSALSFTRALQRLYESAWRLESRGYWATGWGLLWLVGFVSYFSTLSALNDAIDVPGWNLAVSLALGAVLWLATPYLLLSRRISWRRLVPSALLTAAAMTAASFAAVIYMPEMIESYAGEFGTIGVAFALLSWLIGLSMVLMVSATGGAVIAEWRDNGPDDRLYGSQQRAGAGASLRAGERQQG
jgi:membrane protein